MSPVFHPMQELQVPHLHEQADLGIFFRAEVAGRLLDSADSRKKLSHWIPSFTGRFSENIHGSLQIVSLIVAPKTSWIEFRYFLTISQKLRYFQMVPWSEIGPSSYGPDVMDSRNFREILLAWSCLVIYLAGTRPGKRADITNWKNHHAIFMGKSTI